MSIKVLMFGWEFPPFNSGGLGTACLGLSQALAEQEVELMFVLPKRVDISPAYLKLLFANIENVKFTEVDTPLHPYITSQEYSLWRDQQSVCGYGRNLLEEVRLYGQRASQIAEDNSFDVIHAHDWLSFPAGIAAKRASGKPLVVHVHATQYDHSGGQPVDTNISAIEAEGLRYADGIITVSQRTKDMVVKHYGVSPSKIKVVHNGINLNDRIIAPAGLEALRAAGNKIILFVGRLTLMKGPDYFIRLAKTVLEHEPKTYFVIAGSGDMERQIIRLGAQLGISDKIIYAGFARGQELESLYQAADIYVMPSVSEPFGLTSLESMASGTPVLMSKQSGVSEVVSHALKTHFWDTDEMANQLVTLLQNDSLAETLRRHGLEEVKYLDWNRAAGKCINYYQSLMSQPI